MLKDQIRLDDQGTIHIRVQLPDGTFHRRVIDTPQAFGRESAAMRGLMRQIQGAKTW